MGYIPSSFPVVLNKDSNEIKKPSLFIRIISWGLFFKMESNFNRKQDIKAESD
jgi:hypothetical protein